MWWLMGSFLPKTVIDLIRDFELLLFWTQLYELIYVFQSISFFFYSITLKSVV